VQSPLDEDYQQLLRAMGHAPVAVDTLVQRSGLTAETVSSMLLILELDGRVSSAPGGAYIINPSGVA
jgi:DNA processing protein